MNTKQLLPASIVLALASGALAQDCLGPDLFGEPIEHPVVIPWHVSVGDLDGDGALDVVAGGYFSHLVILPGNGDGTLGPAFEPEPGLRGADMAIADMNGDGLADIVTGTTFGVAVLINRGALRFDPAVIYTTGVDPLPLGIADFNHDGSPDLVAASRGDDTIAVLLNDGAGGLVTSQTFDGFTDIAWTDLAVGDINHDGHTDVYVTKEVRRPVGKDDVLLLGRGDGTFDLVTPRRFANETHAVTIADVDSDGRDDVVIGAYSDVSDRSRLWTFAWQGGELVQFGERWTAGDGSSLRSVLAADANGDGVAELFTGLFDLGEVRMAVRQTADPLVYEPPVGFGAGAGPSDLAMGDMDGDGRPDLIVASRFDQSVNVLLNRCAPPCQADLDGDGELTIFDFLSFQNLFDAGDPAADFDGDGSLTIFDFLAFQNAFDAGC
ncbi:MAG: FG-GAP-like repeat-containing protein [Phycisphaerales bacterium]